MRYAILLLIAALAYQLLSSLSSTTVSPTDDPRVEQSSARASGSGLPSASAPRSGSPSASAPRIEHRSARASGSGPPGASAPRIEHLAAHAWADGAVPEGTTVFDDEIPGVANLHPSLLGALRRAAVDAAVHGNQFFVNSGWRSPKYQEQLLHQAVSKYGSEREAARWVATPETSAHVSGEAVDIAPFSAIGWLSEYGARYGLCQIYRNEPWHFELRPEAIDHGCPPQYPDPTHDPRMKQ